MSERKVFLEGKIAQLKAEKESGVSMNRLEEIARDLQAFETELQGINAAEEVAAQQQAAQVKIQEEHVARVSTVATQFDEFLEKMNLGGMTLRQVVGGASEYQLITIELKKAFTAQAEQFSTQLSEQQAVHNEEMRASQDRENQLQRQNENLQARAISQESLLDEASRKANQDALERANLEQSRNNAVAQLEEAKIQIAQQKGHIEDLQTQIAIGVRGAINVIDTEEEERQKKELADQIRKERTIYDVEWVDVILRNRKKAKLAVTGEEIEFPWTEEGKYFVIPSAEVSQFRNEYPSNQEAVSDSPLGHEETPNVTLPTAPEATFPELPRAEAPSVPAVPTAVVEGQQSVEVPGEAITSAQLEDRLVKFAQEHGLVKQAVA